MTRYKSGFTLIEVMVALAILAITLTSIGYLQVTLMQTSVKSSNRLDQLWNALFFMHETDAKDVQPNKKISHSTATPSAQLTYEKKAPAKNSALAGHKDIVLETVTYQWQAQTKKLTDVLVTLRYNPEREKEEEKEHETRLKSS